MNDADDDYDDPLRHSLRSLGADSKAIFDKDVDKNMVSWFLTHGVHTIACHLPLIYVNIYVLF